MASWLVNLLVPGAFPTAESSLALWRRGLCADGQLVSDLCQQPVACVCPSISPCTPQVAEQQLCW